MTDLAEPFRSLFETNMGVKPQERILVFSDTVRPDEQPDPQELDRRQRLLAVAEAVASYAKKQYGGTTFISYPATPASGA
ncbi:MAG TPA: peptidase, partial [Geobacterales bacterium]|nr:peptidase [Geobacterales bacterium]